MGVAVGCSRVRPSPFSWVQAWVAGAPKAGTAAIEGCGWGLGGGVVQVWADMWHRSEGSAQHLPALIEGVIRFALKFSPLKRGEAERWKGLLTEEVSVHQMKGNFRGIYLPSWMVRLKALRGLAAFIVRRGCAQKILQMGLRWFK